MDRGNKTETLFVALALTAGLWGAVATHAAVITWNAPVQITSESDVITDGVLFQASNFGNSSVTNQTINGVTFEAAIRTGTTTETWGNVTLSPTVAASANFLGSATTGSAAYNAMLAQTLWNVGQPSVFTINGLTDGQNYMLQYWVNDSRSIGSLGSRSVTFQDDSGGMTSDAVLEHVGPTGNLGQYIVGTFTADGTSQVVNLVQSGSTEGVLNAFQIRNIPEPASLGLLAIGGLLVGSRRRRDL